MKPNSFQLGQICEGEGLKFEVIKVDPLQVRCLENSGWWARYNRGMEDKYHTWKVGIEYELYLGSEIAGRNFNFKDHRLPWVSLYENGKAYHYR